jgi:hypothetical protein
LIWIAEEAFDNLPEGWEFGIGEGEHAGIPFFYNSETGESDWKHPNETHFMKKVKKEREAREEKNNQANSNPARKKNQDNKLKVETSFNNNSGVGEGKLSSARKDSGRPAKEKADIEEIVDVEDFDEPRNDREEKKTAEIFQNGTKKRDKDRPSFGMSEEDFLDVEKPTLKHRDTDVVIVEESHMNKGKGNNYHHNDEREERIGRGRSKFENKPTATQGAWAQQDEDRFRGDKSISNQKDTFDTRKDGLEDRSRLRSESPRGRNREDSMGDGSLHDRDEMKRNQKDDARSSFDRKDRRFKNTDEDRERGWDRNLSGNVSSARSRDQSRDQSRERSARDSPVKEVKFSPIESHNADYYEQQISALQRLIGDYKHDKERLLSEISDLKQRITQESLQHKEETRSLENRIFEERREVKLLNDKLMQQFSENQSKIKEIEENSDFKAKELHRKLKQDTEEEYHEKVKVIERKHLEELDVIKSDLQAQKRKFDDLSRDYEFLKRKSFYSKEETHIEAQKELDAYKSKFFELEETHLQKISENKKLQEEILNLKLRINSLTQDIQKLTMDNEHLKISQKSVTEESAVQNSVYLQTLEKISKLEIENSQLKSEVQFLYKDKDNLELENRKMSAKQLVAADQVSSQENALRRHRISTQNEISLLSSKVIELEATNAILKEQIDKQLLHDSQELKSFQLINHSLETENQRLKEKLFEMTMKDEEQSLRIRNQEKDILNLQEIINKKDRLLKEEKRQQENVQELVTRVREDNEKDRQSLLSKIKDIQQEKEALTRSFQAEIQEMQLDTVKQLPKLIQQSLSKHQGVLQDSFQSKLGDLKNHYEKMLSQKDLELNELKQYYAEKDVKIKLFLQEEKLQFEHLQAKNKDLISERDSLENMLYETKKQCKMLEYHQLQLTPSIQVLPPQPPTEPLRPAAPSLSPENISQRQFFPQPLSPSPPVPVPVPAPASSVIPFDTLEFLKTQLAVMKVQITESLQSTILSQTHPSNKENQSDERANSLSIFPQHEILVSSVDIPPKPRIIPDKPRSKALSGNDSLHSILDDEESALFLSPQRKGIDQKILLQKRKEREGGFPTKGRNVTFDESIIHPLPGQETSSVFLEPTVEESNQSLKKASSSLSSHDEPSEPFHYGKPGATSLNRPVQDYRQTYSSYSVSSSLNNENSSILNSSVEVLDEVPSFDNLRNGGYYEGYWKAKYSKYR